MALKLGFSKKIDTLLREQQDDLKIIGCTGLKGKMDEIKFDFLTQFDSKQKIINSLLDSDVTPELTRREKTVLKKKFEKILGALEKEKVIKYTPNGTTFDKDKFYRTTLNCGKYDDGEKISNFTQILMKMQSQPNSGEGTRVAPSTPGDNYGEGTVEAMPTLAENSASVAPTTESYTLKGAPEKMSRCINYDILIILVIIFIILINVF